jgi:hypothetical protein
MNTACLFLLHNLENKTSSLPAGLCVNPRANLFIEHISLNRTGHFKKSPKKFGGEKHLLTTFPALLGTLPYTPRLYHRLFLKTRKS